MPCTRRYPSSVTSLTTYPVSSMPHATTRLGDPLPVCLTRFPTSSRVHPLVALRIRSVARRSYPGVAMSAIHVETACEYGGVASVSCERTLGAPAAIASSAPTGSASQRKLDILGKSGILVRKECERGLRIGRDGRRRAGSERESPARHGVEHARIENVLDAQHATGERSRVVAREHRHRPLCDDR